MTKESNKSKPQSLSNLIELSGKTKDTKIEVGKQDTKKSPSKDALVITRIQAQKAKNRFNIFVNNEYAFAVDDNILVSYRLIKGKVLTKEDIEELKQVGEASKAYQVALNYLNFKMRSEKEIRDHLHQKDYEYIEIAIERLKKNRMINDEEYARSFVRTTFQLKNEGPKKIERELRQKGLTQEEILSGLEEYSWEKQKENAIKAAEKTLNRQRNKSNKEIQQKLKEQLMLKGFENDIISEVLNELSSDQPEDEEYEALEIQGEKAWNRYSRKHKNRALVQKTKTFLYSKGYPRELIDRYITEKEGDY